MWKCLSWCEPKGWDKNTARGGGFLKIPSKKTGSDFCWAISPGFFSTRHCPELPRCQREATAFASLGKAGSLICCLFEQLRMSADGHVGCLESQPSSMRCQRIRQIWQVLLLVEEFPSRYGEYPIIFEFLFYLNCFAGFLSHQQIWNLKA